MVTRGLLVAVGDLEQCRFAPGAPENLKPGGQAATDKSHRDSHGRKTGRRGEPIAVIPMRAVEVTDHPWWIVPRWIDQCVEPGVIHRIEHALGKAAPVPGGLFAFRIPVRRWLSLRI